MNTYDQLLNLAQREIQEKGYSAFSYADLAKQIGISKASIHHHFPSKADLGKEVARRYWQVFGAELDSINRETTSAPERLRRYADIFQIGLERDHVVCAGMMLASDIDTLPQEVADEVEEFIQLNESWLENVLKLGESDGSLHFYGTPTEVARTIFTAFEGAMLISRVDANTLRLRQVIQWLLNSLIKH